MSFLDRVQNEHDRLTGWLKDNWYLSGTNEYLNAALAHRLLTDLLARNGGAQAEQDFVERALKDLL